MRQILHIDMNSYFATVEQQANPRLREKPIAVLGSTTKRSIIVAASIEAKRQGVKTAMRIEEAMEKCPGLILVSGEPRKYSWVTKQFVRIFEDYTDKVEIFSIDECFLDVTGTAHLYFSSEAKHNREVGSSRLRSNNNFDGAINIAMEIKKRIREEIGSWISCSVGVSYNKFLAKTGSDLQKPDGLVVIKPNPVVIPANLLNCHFDRVERAEKSPVLKREKDLSTSLEMTKNNNMLSGSDGMFRTVDEVLLNLPLSEYCGIGRRILKRLNLLDIYTTQDLRNFSNIALNKEFGIATGQKLKRMAYGLDNSQVLSWHDQAPAKSFSCSRTMNRDIVKTREIEKQILFLLEKVAKKMRDDGYFGREAGLWLRFKDFSGVSKTRKIGKWTNDGMEMNGTCLKILKQIKVVSPVRAIGVYIGDVQLAKNVSQSMMPEDKLNEKILQAMDAVNNRFGEDVLTRATLAGTKLKEVVSGMGRKKF